MNINNINDKNDNNGKNDINDNYSMVPNTCFHPLLNHWVNRLYVVYGHPSHNGNPGFNGYIKSR
jgi:hypothetical protein